MNAAKRIILFLWLLTVASLGNVSAFAPGTAENRAWEKSFGTLQTRQAKPLETAGRHQENGVAGYDFAPDSLLAAEGGVRFGQQGISATFRDGEFAGQAIEDVAAGLRSGAISPSQLPLQTITRDGITYTLNNRSLMALRQAGMEPTVLKDVTGNAFFEKQLTERLAEMGGHPPADSVPVIRPRKP